MTNAFKNLLDCYIYFYHTDEYFILPQYPENISDTISSSFAQQNALARTAPIFSYSNSGPRTVNIVLNLHRDMLNDVNSTNSNITKLNLGYTYIDGTKTVIDSTDDYVDLLIKKLQAIVLPKYNASNKDVDPPRVAIRFGNEIFIKGVVTSGINITYHLPLMEVNGERKYAMADISFSVSETDPFDAESAGEYGSFRLTASGRDIRG